VSERASRIACVAAAGVALMASLEGCIGPAARGLPVAHAYGPDGGGDPFVAAFQGLRPSVVLFTMKIPSDDKKKAARGERDDAYGSGVIVASGAWGSRILTVEHVVHDATALRITIGEHHVVPCRVVATDAKADLAIVETSAAELPVATLGRSRAIVPGMQIGVAGYPIPDAFQDEGLITATSVFAGRVSSVRNDSVELDVPIIPGESGGPIFDASDARVIALAESRFDEERAIGFGIPIDDATRFLAKHPRRLLRANASERVR